MTLTFVDAGVLIAAFTGKSGLAARALAILDDPDRLFASSDFVRLEVLPKALFHKNEVEAQFYEAFFQSVSHWPADNRKIVKGAYGQGVKYGLAAMDALHVAAAVDVGARELATTEKSEKPLHRATEVTVRSIHPDADR